MSFLCSRRSRVACAALLFGFFLILAACSGGRRMQMRRAERLERDGRPASALAIYDSLLPLVSRKDTSLIAAIERRRADCLLDLGRVAEAFTAYNKSLDANPSDLDTRLKLARS